MPAGIRYPQYSSENVRLSRNSARYDCEDCQHVSTEEKPLFPTRIVPARRLPQYDNGVIL